MHPLRGTSCQWPLGGRLDKVKIETNIQNSAYLASLRFVARCPWHGACFSAATGDIEDFPGLDSLASHQVTAGILKNFMTV